MDRGSHRSEDEIFRAGGPTRRSGRGREDSAEDLLGGALGLAWLEASPAGA